MDAIERAGQRLVQTVERHRDVVVRDAEACFRTFLADLEGRLRAQTANYQVSIWDSLWTAGDVRKRLAAELESWLKKETHHWQETGLAPLIERHVKALDADLNNQAAGLLMSLAAVRAAFTLGVLDESEREVSPISRVVGATGGLLVGGIGSALEGANLGTGAMAKLVAVGKPEEIRDQAVAAVIRDLRAKQPKIEADLTTQVGAAFDHVLKAVSAGVRIKIDEVKGQIQAVVANLEQHKDAVERALTEVATIKQQLKERAQTLQQLRVEIESA